MVNDVMMPSMSRRDRVIVLSAVAAAIVVAWIYVVIQAQGMSAMAGEEAIATIFVLIEKALPFGNVAGLVSGPLMIAAGIYVLL